MSGIRRRGGNHPGGAAKKTIDLRDRVAQPIEEDNVFSGDVGAAIRIVPSRQEFSRLQQTFGWAVAVGAVFHSQLGYDLLHPGRDSFSNIIATDSCS
jgi:hypothetical protein